MTPTVIRRHASATARTAKRAATAALLLVLAVSAISEPSSTSFLVNQFALHVSQPDGGVTGSGDFVFVWANEDTNRVMHRRMTPYGFPLMSESVVGDVPG